VRPTDTNGFRPFFVMGSVVLVIAMLYWAQKVLVPVALAILIAFVLAPFVIALQRRGLNRVFAAMLVVAASLLIVVGIGSAITLQFGRLLQELPQYKQNIVTKIEGIREAGRW
jgi:predicted PurR-regulated permease PerM